MVKYIPIIRALELEIGNMKSKILANSVGNAHIKYRRILMFEWGERIGRKINAGFQVFNLFTSKDAKFLENVINSSGIFNISFSKNDKIIGKKEM